jgi:hypothetical protein
MARVFMAGVLVAVLVLVPAQSVAAQTAQGCQSGQTPQFTFGFADLKGQIGDAMGDPVTCEFADPKGTGDIQQRTTTGLAFWRKSTNTPTFTDGFDHWAQTPDGWVTWTGASVDPPTANAYPDSVVQGFLSGCVRGNPNNQELQAACSCAIQRIENTYTLGEFLNIAANLLQQGTLSDDFTAVIADCVQQQFASVQRQSS